MQATAPAVDPTIPVDGPELHPRGFLHLLAPGAGNQSGAIGTLIAIIVIHRAISAWGLIIAKVAVPFSCCAARNLSSFDSNGCIISGMWLKMVVTKKAFNFLTALRSAANLLLHDGFRNAAVFSTAHAAIASDSSLMSLDTKGG